MSTASICCGPSSFSIRPRVPASVTKLTPPTPVKGPPTFRLSRSARSKSRDSTSLPVTSRTRGSWCVRSPARCTGAGRDSSREIWPLSAAWTFRSRRMTVRLVFDRAQARIVLDAGQRLITGALTASSPVVNLRAEGNLGLGRGAEYDLRYDAEGRLEQLGRWWQESPGWQGPVTLQGQLRGPLKRPEATIAAKGTDLRWATLQRAALDATGQVSIEGLVLNALSLTSPQGRLQGSGRFTFRQQGQSEVDARWRDVDGTVITGLFPSTAGDLPRAHLSGSATLTWSGRLPTAMHDRGQARYHRHRRGARNQRHRHARREWARRPLAGERPTDARWNR